MLGYKQSHRPALRDLATAPIFTATRCALWTKRTASHPALSVLCSLHVPSPSLCSPSVCMSACQPVPSSVLTSLPSTNKPFTPDLLHGVISQGHTLARATITFHNTCFHSPKFLSYALSGPFSPLSLPFTRCHEGNLPIVLLGDPLHSALSTAGQVCPES